MPNNQFGIKCLSCGRDDAIEIEAQCWRLLCRDGTDDGPSFDGYSWSLTSDTHCGECGHLGTVASFRARPDNA
jgi:hypothetical protein